MLLLCNKDSNFNWQKPQTGKWVWICFYDDIVANGSLHFCLFNRTGKLSSLSSILLNDKCFFSYPYNIYTIIFGMHERLNLKWIKRHFSLNINPPSKKNGSWILCFSLNSTSPSKQNLIFFIVAKLQNEGTWWKQ